LLPFIFILSSCPTPFDDTYVLQVLDEEGPQITITYPLDGTPYAKTVVVEGYVIDSTGNAGEDGKIISLSYEILGTSERGDVFLYEDNTFRFQFDTNSYQPNTLIVKLIATDWNDNTGETSITLHYAGNDIPTLEAVPGSHQVTLIWDPIPLTESYSIYYTTNGNMPSETYGERIDGITSTVHTIDGLDNGFLHMFLLHAHSLEGEEKDNWSATIMTIPLSTTTLTPKVTGEYGRVLVEWNPLFVPDWYNVEFEIYKSTERYENFQYMSTVKGNSFVDTDVMPDQLYYYKIKEGMSKIDIESMVNTGRTSQLPTNKTEFVGSCSTYYAYAVVVQGSYGYVADGVEGLKVIDVSPAWDKDPATQPLLVGSCDTSSKAWDVAVSGNYAYIADNFDGLKVIDISNPENVTDDSIVGEYPDIHACDVEIRGSYAYVADFNQNDPGLKIIDVSPAWDEDPITQPFLIGTCENFSGNEGWGVSVHGNYAFVAAKTDGLKVIDIDSDSPTYLQEIRSYKDNAPNGVELYMAWDVTISSHDGNVYAYVSDHNGGLKVIDVTDPTTTLDNPIIGLCSTQKALYTVVRDRYAYVADFNGGLKIIDLSEPDILPNENGLFEYTIVGFASIREAWGLDVQDNYVYIASGDGGLQVFEIIYPPGIPATVGSCVTHNAYGLTVSGNYAYIADGGRGLKVVDITEPLQVGDDSVVGSCHTYFALDVAVSGDYAYVADDISGLKVINISDPGNVTDASIVGSYDACQAMDVEVRGDYAYVADYYYEGSHEPDNSNGLKIIDISVPNSPTVVGFYTTYDARSVSVRGNHAYIADWYGGLVVIDISNPVLPHFVTSFTQQIDRAVSVAVKTDNVFIVDAANGPRGVDLSDPSDPILEWNNDDMQFSNNITIAENYAYITIGDIPPYLENPNPEYNGIYIFDIYDPNSPKIIGSCTTANASDVEISGDYAYLADHEEGLKVIELLEDD